ncbi:MAG TPA: hypothetical protein VNX02_04205 [Steroidobacteraceae bacterium]|nr:hypothetical protein [Steroidobacteraceae bacterium]
MHPEPVAANEEFTAGMNPRDVLAHERGWDPYEVWRTRVRTPSMSVRVRKDRTRDPRR